VINGITHLKNDEGKTPEEAEKRLRARLNE
jgi:hypothetical protein